MKPKPMKFIEVPIVAEPVEGTGTNRISSLEFTRSYLECAGGGGTWTDLVKSTGVERGTLAAKLMALKHKLRDIHGKSDEEIAIILPPLQRSERNGASSSEVMDLLLSRLPSVEPAGKFVPVVQPAIQPAVQPARKKK